MARKIVPQSEIEKYINQLMTADGYTFVGFYEPYHGVRSKVTVNCQRHGDWVSSVTSLKRGSRCSLCAKSRPTPQGDVEQELGRLASADGYTFVGFPRGYGGCRSKVLMNCQVHGDWLVAVVNFKNGSRCIKCAQATHSNNMVIPEVVVKQQLGQLMTNDGYAFVGFVGTYHGVHSKTIISCDSHGRWSPTINSLKNGFRCPSCAITGYKPDRPGTLYALMSECGAMVKIGISNRWARRRSELIRATPFKFSTLRKLHFDDGLAAPMLERMFHDQFPSAGLTGFSGATEWRVYHPDINAWLDLLSQ